MVHEIVLKAFDGTLERQPIEIAVRIGESRKKLYVGMGEVRVPKADSNVNVEELEKTYRCTIKETVNGWVIVPNVVRELIEKDGFIASCCDEHRRALRSWMEEQGAELLKILLKR